MSAAVSPVPREDDVQRGRPQVEDPLSVPPEHDVVVGGPWYGAPANALDGRVRLDASCRSDVSRSVLRRRDLGADALTPRPVRMRVNRPSVIERAADSSDSAWLRSRPRRRRERARRSDAAEMRYGRTQRRSGHRRAGVRDEDPVQRQAGRRQEEQQSPALSPRPVSVVASDRDCGRHDFGNHLRRGDRGRPEGAGLRKLQARLRRQLRIDQHQLGAELFQQFQPHRPDEAAHCSEGLGRTSRREAGAPYAKRGYVKSRSEPRSRSLQSSAGVAPAQGRI